MKWLRSFLIVLALSALLARLGPFGTFADLPAPQRAAYWFGLTFLLWLQIEAARHLLRGLGTHWSLRGAAAALLGAGPSAFEVAWAESLLRVERDLGLFDLVKIYGDVLLIAFSLALLLELIASREAPVPAAIASPETGVRWSKPCRPSGGAVCSPSPRRTIICGSSRIAAKG